MPQVGDYVVEIRNRDFLRVGQLAPEYTDLKFVDVHNDVGNWELKLPVEHPLLETAKSKGAGIVVTNRKTGRVFSGRMVSARLVQNAEDPDGTWLLTGVDDNIVAAATLVYPDPANLANAQAAANWNQVGTTEALMKSAVQLNIGSGAIASRKYPWLTIQPDQGRGAVVKCSPRFDPMGEFLTSLGTAGGLGWRFYQSGNSVTFDVYVPADKRGLVRLDIRNGGLDSNELGYSAPAATEVLVLGQGEGALRKIRRVTSTAAALEATEWAIRWERAKDQRNTNDDTELDQAGLEELTASGSTVNTLKVVPSDSPGQALGTDWYVGDRITVVIAGVETDALVTQVATSISSAGVIQQATVGDPTAFDYEAKVGQKISEHEERIGQVERLIGTGGGVDSVPTGTITSFAGVLAPNGYLLCQGQAVSRTTYANLFAVIGTTYGAGDGSTTFNVPNLKGRVPVGQDTADTLFDVLGEVGGSKDHRHVFRYGFFEAAYVPTGDYGGMGASNYAAGDRAGAYKYSTGTFAGMVGSDQANVTRTIRTNGGTSAAPTTRFWTEGDTDLASSLQPYLIVNYIIKHAAAVATSDGTELSGRVAQLEIRELDYGTTTARDARWGVPANAAERLALHNKGVKWYRTDKGWTEQYFTTTADGAVAGKGAVYTSGWHPISGLLPGAELALGTAYGYGTGAQRVYFSGATHKFQADHIRTDTNINNATGGGIFIDLPGRYNLNFQATWTHTVATWLDLTIQHRTGSTMGATNGAVILDASNYAGGTINTGYWTSMSQQRQFYYAAAGTYFQCWHNTGGGTATYQNRGGMTTFAVHYVAPPFVGV